MSPYAILAGIAALGVAFASGVYVEKRHRDGIDAERQVAELQTFQEASRRAALVQRKADDAHLAQTRRLGAQLADALDSLRNRPERPAVPGATPACPGATGAELYQQDAGFLAREAARADQLRADLAHCQGQADEDGQVTD